MLLITAIKYICQFTKSRGGGMLGLPAGGIRASIKALFQVVLCFGVESFFVLFIHVFLVKL